jgi:ElaB/YqjD/DUF883 family membrane-anchored ribosome-binding protein
MAPGRTLRAELDEIRSELARLREAKAETAAAGSDSTASAMGEHLEELNRLVHEMLENAEETIAEHPVATVAGALALGIVIGRLTSH